MNAMNAKSALLLLLAIALLVPGAGMVQAAMIAQDCAFGYTWANGSFGTSWQDISANPQAVELEFSNADDSYTNTPVAIGFSFAYFEENYSGVFVGTNGLLMFSNPTAELRNQSIPRDTPPNDYIAVFWDDLRMNEVATSTIYAMQGGAYPNRYLIVQWNNVVIVGGGEDTYTFQAILRESGNIELNYEQIGAMVDEATVGIEDQDGVDGLLIYYNEAGLTSNSNITITRPTGNYRFKTIPRYQAGFLQDGSLEVDFVVRNTGLVPDTYNLSYEIVESSPPSSSWQVDYFHGGSGALLTDTNSDLEPDTGEVQDGDEFPLKIRISPNFIPGPGNYVLVNVNLAADGYPGTFTVQVQAAVPAPFTQFYTDVVGGVSIEYVFPNQQLVRPVVAYYSGASQSMAGVSETRYIVAWEKQEYGGSSNLQYVVMDALSLATPVVRQFTNFGETPPYVADTSPVLDTAPDGVVGMAYVRRNYVGVVAGDYVNNVYLVRFDNSGNLKAGTDNPRKLTNNTLTRFQENGREMSDPRITALDNNHFAIAWVERNYYRVSPEIIDYTEDIWLAVVDSNNNVVVVPTKITNSTQGGYQYPYPTVVTAAGGKLLLAYGQRDSVTSTVQLAYRYFTAFSGGGWIPAENLVAGTSIELPDAIQLRLNNNFLIAWTNVNSGRIAYLVLNPSASSILSGPIDVPTTDQRAMYAVSVTRDNLGHAILTWQDDDYFEFLYYILINGDGSVGTPTMPFQRSSDTEDPLIFVSKLGGGNAPLVIQQILIMYMPLLFR